MELNYKGLCNIGATCYMNSLLQTLYMTPQFRDSIYEWQYNQKIHPKPADSILYQLQKLFGKLDCRFPGEVTTRDLVKSFQWQDEEAQMQQDIQQFNRVLFEALEKSLSSKKDQNHFVRDLYEGEMIHYTHCKECQNQSQREETFQDLILTVKNPFEKVYNKSVELGIQRYMKPEVLDQDNMYFCESCQKKVMAERGVRFLKMPKLLSIILRRFDFDYFTFQRVKLNDRVEFPHVLNINSYMQGYDQIQNKLSEDAGDYFLNKPAPEKYQKPALASSTTTGKKVVKKSSVNVAGKITTKPSVNTKSFLTEMRKKKMQSGQANQDLVFVNGSAQMHAQPQQSFKADVPALQVQGQTSKQTEPAKNPKLDVEPSTSAKKAPQPDMDALVVPPILDLPIPSISQPFKHSEIPVSISIQDQLASKLAQKQQQDTLKQTNLLETQQRNQQLIAEYMKEGQLVYQLYSVLVHNGSANHGHYYSYIKSSDDGKWYCFNDDRVTEINVHEIEKTFGGVGNSNAYALSYRQCGGDKEEPKCRPMPKYIQQAVQDEALKLKTRQREKVENLENVLVLKIYYQLSVKVLEITKTSSLQLCLLKAREMFSLPETVKVSNTRLRMFNPASQAKLDTYGGRQHQSLQDLKILSYRNLLLEVKNDDEQFQEYIAGKINLRIALWQQCKDNIKSLDQSFLTLHKVAILKGCVIKQIERVVKKKRKQVLNLENQNEPICIVKRHQNDEYSYHQIINLPDYLEKSMDQVMVMQNEVLFIEAETSKLNWPEQFDNQLYRITIKYVNGETSKTEQHLTDSRKTLGELKQQLCGFLGMAPEDTIIRRGNRNGLEFKNESTSMKELRFITGTQVYLQRGLPAKTGEVRIQLYIATDAPDDMYNRLHEFQFVADVPINGQLKASDIKLLFVQVLKKYKGMELKPEEFRVREKVCDKIGKIYRERPMKQQQLIEKRQIAIERKPDGVDVKQFKDFQIYVRIWDPENWRLSPKIELNVDKSTSMRALGDLIYLQNDAVPTEEMQICRILSINKFNILQLVEMEYFEMTEASVISEPLFVNADGLMFIVKSKLKQPRDLTAAEQAHYGGNIRPKANGTRVRQTNTKKQKGVSITVIQKKQQPIQEQNGEKHKLND